MTSTTAGRPSQDVAARPVNQQPIEHALHLAQLLNDGLPQHLVVTQALRFDALHDVLALAHQFVELLAAANIELSKPREELRQVLHGRVAKDLGLAVLLAAQPLDQVRDRLGPLVAERLFGKLNSRIESLLEALALLLVKSGI